MENRVITLRSVLGPVKEYHFQPCRQKNGVRYSWVKPVRYDSQGNSEMILSPDEMNDPNRDYFIPEDMDIVVTSGTTFDLNNPLEYNIWMSIKDNDLIVPTRDAKDNQGNLYIDGNQQRYGIAELYVEVPGETSERNVSRMQKINKAWTYIGADSPASRLTKCKLLGKYMGNAPATDVEEYLYQRAEKNPDEIIDLYTGGDMKLKLLFIDARDRGKIVQNKGMYFFGEVPLGVNDEAVILFFKQPDNKKILEQIKLVTYPEYAPVSKLDEAIKETEAEVKKASKK